MLAATPSPPKALSLVVGSADPSAPVLCPNRWESSKRSQLRKPSDGTETHSLWNGSARGSANISTSESTRSAARSATPTLSMGETYRGRVTTNPCDLQRVPEARPTLIVGSGRGVRVAEGSDDLGAESALGCDRDPLLDRPRPDLGSCRRGGFEDGGDGECHGESTGRVMAEVVL